MGNHLSQHIASLICCEFNEKAWERSDAILVRELETIEHPIAGGAEAQELNWDFIWCGKTISYNFRLPTVNPYSDFYERIQEISSEWQMMSGAARMVKKLSYVWEGGLYCRTRADFFAHLSDQIPSFSQGFRSAGAPTLPSPKQAKILAVPCNHSLWNREAIRSIL
jgi:hypothetical protein